MRIVLIISVLIVVLLNGACSSGVAGPEINVSDPWVRASGPMEMNEGSESMAANTAGYMLVENDGNQPDKLLGAQSDIAEAVELHQSEIVDDVMKMRQVESIEVPPNSKVELKPGGYHIMFIGLKDTLNSGDRVEITLVFEKFGELPVLAEVRAP